MRADIAEGKSGGLVGWLEGEEYYIVYQPSGMEDWSIVGVVRASAVEAGMRKMQADTISLATLIASLTMLGVSWLILANMKAEAKSLKMEQQMLSRQKEVSDRLFTGMGADWRIATPSATSCATDTSIAKTCSPSRSIPNRGATAILSS